MARRWALTTMSQVAGHFFEVVAKDGSIVSSGRLSKKVDEVMVNRSIGHRLYTRPDEESEWVEVGAYAEKVACNCADGKAECDCNAAPTEHPAIADLIHLSDHPINLRRMPTAATGSDSTASNPMSGTGEPPAFSAAHSALSEPIQSSFLAPKNDPQGAPGEYGQYASLYPQPVDVIEAWGLPWHLGDAIAYIARAPRKGGKLDLEKAIWHIQREIDRLYGQKSL